MNTPERRTQHRLAEAQRREQLTDTYIRDVIAKHGYDGHEITAAEIQTNRQQLLVWRATATCQCRALALRRAIQCKVCRRKARRAGVSSALRDAYVQQAIKKQAAKAGRPILPGQEISAAEIEARRQSILAGGAAVSKLAACIAGGHGSRPARYRKPGAGPGYD